MIILRQKEFGWFGFGKKKEEPKKLEYKCPKFSDLPTNLQQGLRGVDRVWRKSDTQKLLKELQKEVSAKDIPFKPIMDPKEVESIHKALITSMEVLEYPESSLIYPLLWGLTCDGGPDLFCYDISTKKFYSVDWVNDLNFYEIDIKSLRDYIKVCLEDLDDYDLATMDDEQFFNLKKKIKKAFWIS